ASFRIGIAQITRDGTLPFEMQRGARALHYHLFAAAPLVAIAELAAANGMDLYSEEHHALPRLVHRALGGVDDSAFFTEKTGQEQEPFGVDAAAIGWAAPRRPAAKLCYRFGPLTPSARSANLIRRRRDEERLSPPL